MSTYNHIKSSSCGITHITLRIVDELHLEIDYYHNWIGYDSKKGCQIKASYERYGNHYCAFLETYSPFKTEIIVQNDQHVESFIRDNDNHFIVDDSIVNIVKLRLSIEFVLLDEPICDYDVRKDNSTTDMLNMAYNALFNNNEATFNMIMYHDCTSNSYQVDNIRTYMSEQDIQPKLLYKLHCEISSFMDKTSLCKFHSK